MMEITETQRRRLEVVRHYHAYVRALHGADLNHASVLVQECRRALAASIEAACSADATLLQDFKQTFAARPYWQHD